MVKTTKNTNNTWWQLFKIGKWTSSSGKEFSADENKLDEIISATKNRIYVNDEIPICIGHKKEDSPKWGAFKKDSFKRAGDFLVGKYEYLVNEFAEAIDRKMFDKVSIALYPDNSIKHVAILGVQAPAVPALEGIELASDEEGAEEYEFSEVEISTYWFSQAVGVFKSIKNFLIDKFGLEETEKIIPEDSLTNLGDPPRVWTTDKNYFTEKNQGAEMGNEKTIDQVTTEFTEILNAADQEKKALNNALAAANAKLQEAEINQFCESAEVKNKITPAIRPHVVELMKLVSNEAEYEFAEGDGKAKITPVDALKKIISSLPDMPGNNEFAANNNAAGNTSETDEFSEMNVNEESYELHKKAVKIQQAEKCSYAEAVNKAAKQ
jgi:hypothetical protein